MPPLKPKTLFFKLGLAPDVCHAEELVRVFHIEAHTVVADEDQPFRIDY